MATIHVRHPNRKAGLSAGRKRLGEPVTNQIVLDASGLHHMGSDTPTFTRPNVDIVQIGGRIENGPAAGTVTDQAPVACSIADNGSVIHDLMK